MQIRGFAGRIDPARAHGAWVFLFASTGAGALVGSGRGVEIPMLVGSAFAGGFLVAAAIAAGLRRKRRQALVGATLVAVAPLIALWLGADRGFLIVAACSAVPAVLALVLERTTGFLSVGSVTAGVAALVMAGPTAAVAGGVSFARASLILVLLVPFFTWRSIRIAKPLHRGAHWDRVALRARGLREAGLAAAWALAAALALRVL